MQEISLSGNTINDNQGSGVDIETELKSYGSLSQTISLTGNEIGDNRENGVAIETDVKSMSMLDGHDDVGDVS